MSSQYAKNTSVSISNSKAEIERTLMRYGANKFGYMIDTEVATIVFEYKNKAYRFPIPLPGRDAEEFKMTPTGRSRRDSEAVFKEWENACKQRWRVALLIIKANMEAVENGYMKFQTAFLPWLALPNGENVDEWLGPQLDALTEKGKMPKLLGWGKHG